MTGRSSTMDASGAEVWFLVAAIKLSIMRVFPVPVELW